MNEEDIKVGVSKEEDCRRVLSIEIGKHRFADEREKVLGDFVREVSLPGFRKGKVPRNIVATRFADEIHAETLKSILPAAYSHAVSSENLEPIGDPVFKDIVAENDKPVMFNVELEVSPKVEISGYSNVNINREDIKVEDEEVDKVIENLRDRYADFESVDRECEEGDVAVIDYVPVDDEGNEEDERKVKDYRIVLGAGQILPDFEKELVGTKPGATKEIEIAYPEDYRPEELAGKKIKYRFAVNEVMEKKIPPLNDEFASSVDEKFKSLDDLKKDIRDKLTEEKKKDEIQRMRESAIDRIIEENPFDIPLSMVERYVEAMRNDAESRGQRPQGEDEEAEGSRKKQDEIFEKIARRNIKRYFIMDYIIKKEKVEIDDTEVDKKIGELSQGTGKPLEEVKKYFVKGSEGYRNLKTGLIEDKVFEVILPKDEE